MRVIQEGGGVVRHAIAALDTTWKTPSRDIHVFVHAARALSDRDKSPCCLGLANYHRMRRTQSVRNHVRNTSMLEGNDELGMLRETEEDVEEALRRQLLEKDRENDKVYAFQNIYEHRS